MKNTFLLALVAFVFFQQNLLAKELSQKKAFANGSYNPEFFQAPDATIVGDKSSSLKIDTTTKVNDEKSHKFWDDLDWIGGDLNRIWLETDGRFMIWHEDENSTFDNYSKISEPRSQTLILAKYGSDEKSVTELFSNSVYMRKFRSLNFRSAGFTVARIKQFSQVTFSTQQAIDLYLGLNKFGNEGARELSASILPKMKQLQVLDLESNNIGPDGVKELIKNLRYLTQLRALYLGSNNLGQDGINELIKALPSLSKLRILSLKSNNIGAAGVKKLASVIPHLSQLQILDLKSNNLGDAGLVELAKVFPYMMQLQFLDLDLNNVSDSVKQEITKSTAKLPKLKELWI